MHQTEQVKLHPVLLYLAVHHAVDLDAGEGYFLAGRRHALELALVGATKRYTSRYHLLHREDVLNREPKVGKRLREGAAELRPGLQAHQGARGTWDVSYIARGQEVHFGLPVALVVRLDPPANDGLVVFCWHRSAPFRAASWMAAKPLHRRHDATVQ